MSHSSLVSLAELSRKIKQCKDCPLHEKGRVGIPGVGPINADVMVVGQAPGWQENRDGVPWVGAAGQFLSAHLERLGLDFKKVYYTNLVRHYPGRKKIRGRGGGDEEPPEFAIEACKKHLLAEIAIVRPKIIVAVGAIAMRFFGIKGGIRINGGRVFNTPYGKVIPILHPAGLMRRPTDTPQFATQLNIIPTALHGMSLPPAWAVPTNKSDEYGLDIETEDGQVWCVGVSDDQHRFASRGVGLAVRPGVPVIHNAKYDLAYLERAGVTYHDHRDTILEAHFLGYHPLGLKKLAPVFLGINLQEFGDVVGKGQSMDSVGSQVLEYCSIDAWATYALHNQWKKEMEPFSSSYEKERRITRLLIKMESVGLPISQKKLVKARQTILSRMGVLEQELQALGIPEPANLEFIAQKFWRGKRKLEYTKSGELSTRAIHLKQYATPDQSVWVDKLIEWRQLDKFRSTYIENWVGKERLYPSLNQTGTMTWRFTCTDLLQTVAKSRTIPVYQLFVAPEGWTFISADYNQIELRVLANLSRDPHIIKAYLSGSDLHQDAVARTPWLANMALTDADKARRLAKIRNFGIVYGITPFGLAPKINGSVEEAAQHIESFYELYPYVKPWQDGQIRFAEEHGYVLGMDGRRLYIPGIFAEYGKIKDHARKQALNFPVQFGAITVVKDAMLRCPEYLISPQVHDELLYLVPEREAPEYKKYLEKTLVDTRDDVPYSVEVKVGKTWGDIKNIADIWEDEFEEEENGVI